MKQNDTQRILALWLGGLFFVAYLAYAAFHYARLTDFPIGDDPAIHIHAVKATSSIDLLSSTYPLPLLIFKVAAQVTGLPHPALFVSLICTFLFFSALSLTWFVGRSFRSWPLAVAAAIIFVNSRWVNDGLHMGLLAETFSWSILFLALGFLAQRNLIGLLVASGLLVLSHPFSTMIYAVLFIAYTAIVFLQTRREDERAFLKKVWLGYAVLTGLALVVKPGIVQRFLSFTASDPAGWGNRNLAEILLSDDERRMFIPFMAGLGLFAAARAWRLPGSRITILLLILGLFFSLNYLFGVNFIPFRFYVYLEMALAILAGYALLSLFTKTGLGEGQIAVLVAILAYCISLPNLAVNQTIGYWQATVPEARSILLPADREAIAWLAENTAPGSSVMAARSTGIWVIALAERETQLVELHYDEAQTTLIFQSGQLLGTDYLYYPKNQPIPAGVIQRYHQVYENESVSIWQVDNAHS